MDTAPVQIIKSTQDNTIVLDEDALRLILTRDEIKDRYVSVISITGALRQGKSFLLNFLLRYLQIRYVENRDVTEWLQPEGGPLKGFKWSPGSKRHTMGIHMWPEIFLAEGPRGQKVAVILLDTQGAFDNQTTIGDCARIFALSTLISSVQIFNVMRSLKQYDLSHLQMFGGYGSLLTNGGSAPFQNLCFLVRDWAYPYEHTYGDAGGAAFLEEALYSDEPEIKDQIETVRDLFKEMSCFLLPYPGRAVNTSKTFVGDLNEIDEDFKTHVQDFVTMLLSPENLVLKEVNGAKVTAEELMLYIQEYSDVLKENALPKVETIFKATVEAHYKSASIKAFKFYKKLMDCDVKYSPRLYTDVNLYKKHESNMVKSVDSYNSVKKFDEEAVFDKYLVELKNAMDAEFKNYRKINQIRQKEQEELKKTRDKWERSSPLGGSGGGRQSTSGTAEAVGIAAGIIGGAALLAFGASKIFSSSKGGNE